MPCFKGIAVSIHANGAPLPEYGIQKQSRFSRISTYIPVPPPQIQAASNKPEPARFAISITLLTPGLPIPYSTPKPTESNPKPKPEYVGNLPSANEGPKIGSVAPYIAMTTSPHETIAAYIYFDGRVKEEVATLLRPGEETWVNSRWVQVPESEGGGLAEREFLFREVGLERWLNGLDLQGDDAQAKLERRRKKFEKRRRRQRAEAGVPEPSQKDANGSSRDVLRYGADDTSPLQAVFDEDSDSSSDDDEPPEATGQIKVSMFRVLASGEIKKGEYSPQFDAHDDDDDLGTAAQDGANSLSLDADVEHTTSFAKPKTLDPSTISTQTVTGIDGPDKPYATFTFFYRGERQLQKIGVLAPKSSQQTPGGSKRRSTQLDFSSLGPLKTSGTVGFSAFRDANSDAARRRKARKKTNGSVGGALNDDSDDDDDDEAMLGKMQDVDEKDMGASLSPEEGTFQGELADGVGRMRLKRAHSADPDAIGTGTSTTATTSLPAGAIAGTESNTPTGPGTGGSRGIEALSVGGIGDKVTNPSASAAISGDGATMGSPLKKHRPSIGGIGKEVGSGLVGSGLTGLDGVLAKETVAQVEPKVGSMSSQAMEEEEL